MLEKIGLPAKPSLRGNNWVVDASHCQGCSSQFTFINRKHHCRRCGGIFCGSCTQQRMILRGQGDSPVRICEPCKTLEEAARFEMRYGHKRAGKGGSKHASKNEDEVLNQILGYEQKESVSSGRLSHDQQTHVASSSHSQEASTKDGVGGQHPDHHPSQVLNEMGSTTPEELRQQAMDEKKKHRTLKAEGKSEEALRAFKRGKELERQAAALEVQLRKNRKRALSSSNVSDIHRDTDESIGSSRRSKSSQTSEKKDDLAAELRELGWSDMDLHEADKKPATVTLEGELSALLGEVSQKPNAGKRTQTSDKSQVIAHKKKALEFKREGKLAEAKEELKKAKILEKQIEEQELLMDSEDSDDEMSSLLRSLGADTKEELSMGVNLDSSFDFDDIFSVADNLGADLEVTEDDLDDPEMAAALKSMGWGEDGPESVTSDVHFVPIDREAKLMEVQTLKKEALNQKRVGNTAKAMELLKKAKMIEKELDSSLSQQADMMAHSFEMVPNAQTLPVEEPLKINENRNVHEPKTAPKHKLMIQKELLSLKKKALALRREGRVDEAEEELRKGKVLEKQLEEFDSAPKAVQPPVRNMGNDYITDTDIGDNEDVTDLDMQDPNYLSVLKNLGWQDEESENVTSTSQVKINASASDDFSVPKAIAKVPLGDSRKSKGEIQKELLSLKRKALALRRQGETEEAEEVLETAKKLEAQLAEIESSTLNGVNAEPNMHKEPNIIDSPLENLSFNAPLDSKSDPIEDLGSKSKDIPEKREDKVNADKKPSNDIQQTTPQSDLNLLHQEILAHKKKAVALKREGKLTEAKEELRQAKALEKRLEEEKSLTSGSADVSGLDTSPSKSKDISPTPVSKPLSEREEKSLTSGPDTSPSKPKNTSPNPGPKPLSGRERFKLQQQSLNHKRQALKLRREGRSEEADAEFEKAKAIEAQLEELTTGSSGHGAEPTDGVSVEDFLDPQLLSALAAIGISDTAVGSQGPENLEAQSSVASKVGTGGPQGHQRSESTQSATGMVNNTAEEKMQLEEKIKAEKLKALNLKRSGNQADALAALRQAKVFQKKLDSLNSQQ
nr:nucleoprotein TPR [Ipomoea batatas]